jgi:nucleotide-binding universal stress UspA family protein
MPTFILSGGVCRHMTRRVLVPVDDSDRAKDAIEFAVENYPDASITALHVVNPSSFPAGGFESGITTDLEQLHELRTERGTEILDDVREAAAELGADVDTVLESGETANTIVEYAAGNDVDLVVIGSHGRTGASRVLLGSVAETVVRRSPVPVTVVR